MRYGIRRFTLLLVLTIGFATPANAARPATPVTVEHLEQFLAASHGQSDGKVASQLAGLVLTERATSVRLARWQAEFPKRRCREALTKLADASAFLALPAADMPANAPPDLEAQKTMLVKAIHSVSTTVTRLPNFYATRKTEYFEDTPPGQTAGRPIASIPMSGPRGVLGAAQAESDYVPMHHVGTSSVTVSYRDGYELTNSKQPNLGAQQHPAAELTTVGEFGPILSLVIEDAVHGAIMWGHWEQGANGMEAVFRYAVPVEKSRYLVAIPVGTQTHQIYPAYHGEIAISPDSGYILRITVVSDFAPLYQKLYTAIVVEYGDVAIGGITYNCPLKGVAVSRMPTTIVNGELNFTAPLQTQMNDVTFTQYHLFRAEARMVPVTSDSDGAPPAATPPAQSPR